VAECFLKEDEVMNRELVTEIAINMHLDAAATSKAYFAECQHKLYVTPVAFSDFLATYLDLFEVKKKSLREL